MHERAVEVERQADHAVQHDDAETISAMPCQASSTGEHARPQRRRATATPPPSVSASSISASSTRVDHAEARLRHRVVGGLLVRGERDRARRTCRGTAPRCARTWRIWRSASHSRVAVAAASAARKTTETARFEGMLMRERIKSMAGDPEQPHLDRHGDDRPAARHRPHHRDGACSSPIRSSTCSPRARCWCVHQPDEVLDGDGFLEQGTHAKSGLIEQGAGLDAGRGRGRGAGARVPRAARAGRTPRRCAATRSARTAASSRAGCRSSRRYFHYRNLDVSTLKELVQRWKPELPRASPRKASTRRWPTSTSRSRS